MVCSSRPTIKYIDLIYRLRDDHDLRQSILRQDRESILEF